MARLKELYRKELVKALMEKLNYKNPMQVPKITKITLNVGAGEAINDKKIMKFVVDDMTKIAGQKPVITYAKKSIAGFKIREGWPVGCKVTLRGKKMYEFLDRLIQITLPRVRDFRGLNPKSFDGYGNYSMGIKEQIVFPEIDFDQIDAIRGMDICITTNARNDNDARALLEAFKFPIKSLTK